MQLKAILCRTSIKKLRSAYYKKLLLTYYLNISVKGKKVKFSHTRYRALGPELIPVYRQSARR